MNAIALPLIALIAFAGYTLSVMLQAEQSLIDFGISLMSRPDTAQVVIDLYLLATLAGIWMYRDARKRGLSTLSVLPYLLITAVFVSVGPLLYLVVRGVQDRKRLPAATQQL
jgi:membrane protease YdiL (CAAX protease family)